MCPHCQHPWTEHHQPVWATTRLCKLCACSVDSFKVINDGKEQ